MPAAIVSYFGKLCAVIQENMQTRKGINDRNHLHGHGYVPGRP
jgi:hypothetical protein